MGASVFRHDIRRRLEERRPRSPRPCWVSISERRQHELSARPSDFCHDRAEVGGVAEGAGGYDPKRRNCPAGLGGGAFLNGGRAVRRRGDRDAMLVKGFPTMCPRGTKSSAFAAFVERARAVPGWVGATLCYVAAGPIDGSGRGPEPWERRRSAIGWRPAAASRPERRAFSLARRSVLATNGLDTTRCSVVAEFRKSNRFTGDSSQSGPVTE